MSLSQMSGARRMAVRNPRTGAFDAEIPVASGAQVAQAAARLRAAQSG